MKIKLHKKYGKKNIEKIAPCIEEKEQRQYNKSILIHLGTPEQLQLLSLEISMIPLTCNDSYVDILVRLFYIFIEFLLNQKAPTFALFRFSFPAYRYLKSKRTRICQVSGSYRLSTPK